MTLQAVPYEGKNPYAPREPERKEILELRFEGQNLTEDDNKVIQSRYGWKLLEDDTFTYTLTIEYWGVLEELLFILSLKDRASIVNVTTKELNDGRCIIQELLCKLEQIEKKYTEVK